MLGNKPPYTTMQQLNLDWVLSKLKTLLRLVPDDGAVGQILRRTRDGAVWSDEQGGGGGGAVQSVNGKTGAVVLDAADVGALPDDYTPPVTSVNGQTGAVTVSVPVQSVNGKTGAVVLDAADVGLANVDNVRQYSATNPPPYPVTSVNGQTGAVSIEPPPIYVAETGVSNGWVYYLLNNNVVIATRTVGDTLTNYTTINGFYGYYIANIETPFTMRGNEYYVGCDWSIGNGFSIPAGRLSVTTTQFNAYCLSTASGSNRVSLRMTLIGVIST